jgi:hypothetical protein
LGARGALGAAGFLGLGACGCMTGVGGVRV